MRFFSTPAIMLRRTDYGDHDVIATLFTLERGKVVVMAKYAKKSIKRFAGVLELFSILNVSCTHGRKGMPILQEVALEHPFEKIRRCITRTAYASYWSELTNSWMEENIPQEGLYLLLKHTLSELNYGYNPEILSLLFQMRFIIIAGFCPNLHVCQNCKTKLDQMSRGRISFDIKRGGLFCRQCRPLSEGMQLSKGTIKQLLWLGACPLNQSRRIRFSEQSAKEGLAFLEVFVPYHLGKSLRSLTFLRKIR